MITSVLSSAAGVPEPTNIATGTVQASRVEAFETAMARQQGPGEADPIRTGATEAPPEAAEADMDAESRARRGLDLEGAAPARESQTTGDMILEGLEQMRGVFDVREARVTDLMSRSSVDANTLLAVQMEMTNFTLLVDITSKLTGKSTQAFDTLMKGQ